MYKLAVLSVVVAAAQAGLISPYAANLGYGNLGYAPAFPAYAGNLGYAANYGYAAPAYATGLNYAAAPAVAAPAVAYAAAAPQVVANAYAVPAPREVHTGDHVATVAEKVEQHGYSVAY